MLPLSRLTKFWVLVSLFSLFGYVFYVTKGSWAIFIGYLTNVQSDVSYVSFTGSVFWGGHIGLTARFLGVLLGISAAVLVWVKGWSFPRVKKIVALALMLDALNFIGLAPSVWWLSRPGFANSSALAVNYFLQVLLLVPVLLVLAVGVWRFKQSEKLSNLRIIASIAFICYVSALVVNEGSRWIGMLSSGGLSFLSYGIRTVGFINAVVFMPIAVVFAIVFAARLIQRKTRSSVLWMGLSLFVIGLNYLIYLVVSYLTDSLNTLPLVDIWAVPLLGLGLALVFNSQKSVEM